MSRIRLVGGTITKTTGGDHNIYSEGNIVYNSGQAVTETSDTGIKYGDPQDIPQRKNDDFDITFELDKKTKSVVPLGILDFKNNAENPYFCFKFGLKKTSIDSLNFQIIGENDEIIYQMTYLQTIIVKASELPKIFSNIPKPTQEPILSKIWDFQKIYNEFASSPGDYTKEGEYVIHWDGFDNNDVYDSARFDGKKLKAKIIATKNNTIKTKEVEFELSYNEVDWVDVKIDRNTKRIDVNLRVNFTDGGAKGLSCNTYSIDTEASYETFTPTTGVDPLAGTKVTVCDWDKVPDSETKKWGKLPIKTRTKSFQDLINLAINGLNYHWGRNRNHAEAKDVKIIGESYELYMNAIVTENKAIGALELIYNTNGNWARSGNPGTIKDPLSAAGNLISRQAICYNVGYTYALDWYEFYKKNNWRYREESDENIEFQETSAHEVGHEILKKYGGTIYSYGHKGTVNPYLQNENANATAYPTSGEIDLMPYYTDWLKYNQRKRIAASEIDALSLLWLTKLLIK
ncbi:hypothetical protein AAFH68_10760 [Flavobacterium sp. CGRL1]|jgi:hypothetical protein